MNERNRRIALGAAALVIVGSIGPWVELKTIFGSISVDGMDGDGQITIIGGILIGVFVFMSKWIGAAIAAALTAAIGVYDYLNISNEINGADMEGAVASVAWGLYAVIAGAGVAFALALHLRASTPDVAPVEVEA